MQILNHWCELRLADNCRGASNSMPDLCIEVFGHYVCTSCWREVSRQTCEDYIVFPQEWLAKGRDN